MAAGLTSIEGSSNLARNDFQDENALLSVLKYRFEEGHIYTYIGEILIAINPNRDLETYGSEWHNIYKGLQSLYFEAPHVYGVAERLIHGLGRTGQDQCCVVTGESGSGKTETCNHLMEHLLRHSSCERTKLKKKIQQANFVLETFGNSSTIQNKNSSRFVKYLVLNYNKDLKLQGACIHHHMLDRSCLTISKQGETNFHVFYYLLTGLKEEQLAPYFLSSTDT